MTLAVMTLQKPSLLNEISQILWGLTIFAFPFNVSILLWQGNLGQGDFNPYTSFSLYGSEILIFLITITWFLNSIFTKSLKISREILLFLGGIWGFSILSILFSQNPIASSLASIHITAFTLVILLITQKILSTKQIKEIFILSVGIQALIGITQFISQHSLGLSFIGESGISPDTSGVAKFNIGGKTFIRSYGTFPHANLFAGYSAAALLFTLQLGWHKAKDRWHTIRKGILGVILIGFLLAYSEAALLAIFLGLVAIRKIRPQVAIIILAILITTITLQWGNLLANESIQERLEYAQISLEMLIENPQGVGLSQFTEHMQEFSTNKLQPWQFQPVHNVYLLVANELGIWTLILMLIALIKTFKTKWRNEYTIALAVTFITIGLFDHYLFSLYQGLILSGLVIGSIYCYCKTVPKNSG